MWFCAMSRRKSKAPRRRVVASVCVCACVRVGCGGHDSKLCFIRIIISTAPTPTVIGSHMSNVSPPPPLRLSWPPQRRPLLSSESPHCFTACTPLKLGAAASVNRLAIRHITKKGLKSPSPPPHLCIKFAHHHQLISRCVTIFASSESDTSPPESSQPVAAHEFRSQWRQQHRKREAKCSHQGAG